jgi:hypothetical protein
MEAMASPELSLLEVPFDRIVLLRLPGGMMRGAFKCLGMSLWLNDGVTLTPSTLRPIGCFRLAIHDTGTAGPQWGPFSLLYYGRETLELCGTKSGMTSLDEGEYTMTLRQGGGQRLATIAGRRGQEVISAAEGTITMGESYPNQLCFGEGPAVWISEQWGHASLGNCVRALMKLFSARYRRKPWFERLPELSPRYYRLWDSSPACIAYASDALRLAALSLSLFEAGTQEISRRVLAGGR